MEQGFTGDSSYDECVVNHTKGIGSDVAAKAILFSCRQLFPDQNAIKPAQLRICHLAWRTDVGTVKNFG